MRQLRTALADQPPVRSGLTVLEVLVTLTIVGVLLALIAPAVLNARAAARRTECQNRIRNVGLAMLAREESAQRFPASGYFEMKSTERIKAELHRHPFRKQDAMPLPTLTKPDNANPANFTPRRN